MDMFMSTDEIVDAIVNVEDIVERKAALRVVVGFALHDKDYMTENVGKDTLAGKLTVSMLFLTIKNMSPKPKGGE